MLTHPTLTKLHDLRLPGMLRAFRQQLQTPEVATMHFDDRFGLIVDQEVTERDSRRMNSRLRHAKLKDQACMENIDFLKPRGIDKSTLTLLATAQWINEHRNVLITGPTGVGKTYLACALAHKACQNSFKTLYARAPRLLHNVAISRADGSYNKFLARLAKLDLLVIDDFALIALADDLSRDFLEIIDDRVGCRSTVIASQLPVDHWHETITNSTIADAILDRVVHKSYKITLKGKSMRDPKEPPQLEAV
jgi:DNA replication protein DnaC